jgi:hypothetical protein
VARGAACSDGTALSSHARNTGLTLGEASPQPRSTVVGVLLVLGVTLVVPSRFEFLYLL